MIRIAVLALILGGLAFGATESGVVRSGGQPIPGATVTAICGTAKIDTVTDDAGRFTMGGLPETPCSFSVSMFGFEPAQRQLTASDAPLNFDLKLQARATLAQTPAAPSATHSPATAPPPQQAAATSTPSQSPTPSQAARRGGPGRGGFNGGPGRGGFGGAAGRGGPNNAAANGRGGNAGFQNLSLVQNGEAALDSGDIAGGTPEDASGSNEAFLVNGSLSQGVQAQPGDNFGLGGPAAFGPGGPGGPAGGANPFGDGADGAPSLAAAPTRRRSGRWRRGTGWRRRWTWWFWRRRWRPGRWRRFWRPGWRKRRTRRGAESELPVRKPDQPRAGSAISGQRLLYGRQLGSQRAALFVHLAHHTDRRGSAEGRVRREPVRLLGRRSAHHSAPHQRRQDVLVRELYGQPLEERFRRHLDGSDDGRADGQFLGARYDD